MRSSVALHVELSAKFKESVNEEWDSLRSGDRVGVVPLISNGLAMSMREKSISYALLCIYSDIGDETVVEGKLEVIAVVMSPGFLLISKIA